MIQAFKDEDMSNKIVKIQRCQAWFTQKVRPTFRRRACTQRRTLRETCEEHEDELWAEIEEERLVSDESEDEERPSYFDDKEELCYGRLLNPTDAEQDPDPIR